MNEPTRPLAITGATLIDGTGRPPLANATVVIDGDRIARVGPTAEGPPPDGAEIIDGRGRFVIPGLTDMHVHVLGPDRWHAPLFLAAGVTTVLDLGGQLPDLTALRGSDRCRHDARARACSTPARSWRRASPTLDSRT